MKTLRRSSLSELNMGFRLQIETHMSLEPSLSARIMVNDFKKLR